MEYETNISMKTPGKNITKRSLMKPQVVLFDSFLLFNPHVLSLQGKTVKQTHYMNMVQTTIMPGVGGMAKIFNNMTYECYNFFFKYFLLEIQKCFIFYITLQQFVLLLK